jgi:hypothetical protein
VSTVMFDNEVVSNMVEEALAFCAEKAGLQGSKAARDALRTGDCCACEYLRYGLAQSVAEYLASVDETVNAVYSYEPEQATRVDEPVPDRPNLSPGLSLIAKVSRKNAGMSATLASLREALAKEHKRLGCPSANATCSQIELWAVDEAEVENRVGYGALLNSLHVRPIKVWPRQL